VKPLEWSLSSFDGTQVRNVRIGKGLFSMSLKGAESKLQAGESIEKLTCYKNYFHPGEVPMRPSFLFV